MPYILAHALHRRTVSPGTIIAALPKPLRRYLAATVGVLRGLGYFAVAQRYPLALFTVCL
jgi:hypothetical protein